MVQNICFIVGCFCSLGDEPLASNGSSYRALDPPLTSLTVSRMLKIKYNKDNLGVQDASVKTLSL
jgi:hypothetical protein